MPGLTLDWEESYATFSVPVSMPNQWPLDVFCFGSPDNKRISRRIDVIHPWVCMRGVVRGVRDYGKPYG
jgi:hypothetical protein